MSASVEYSVVVPAFNEEEALIILLQRVRQMMSQVSESYEIVIVDDGSSDRTYAIISQAAATDARVHGVRLSRNFGQQIAATAGLAEAKGAIVILLGADMEDPPEEVPKLLDRLRVGGHD